MLAGLQALDRLRGVHLRRRRENDRIEAGYLSAFGEIGGRMGDAIFRRRLVRLVEFAADQRDALDAVDQLDRIEMFEAESAGAGERDLNCLGMRCLRVDRLMGVCAVRDC